MRICVINPNFYRSSGVSVVVRRLFKASQSLGVQWAFVTSGYGPEYTGPEEEEAFLGQKVEYVNLMTVNPFRLGLEVIKLIEFCFANKINTIHVHHRRMILIAWIVRQALGTKIIYTGQLTYSSYSWLWPFSVDVAVGISQAVLGDIRSSIQARKFVLLSNPADFPTELIRQDPHDSRHVICVARFADVKNHKCLIAAWEKAYSVERGAKLFLVGEGPLESELKIQVNALGLSDSVIFCGYHKDWTSIAQQCGFAVLASKNEGHPVAVVEAAALGLATLVTNAPGNVDTVPPASELPNKVEVDNVDELAECLSYWLRSPEKVRKNGCVYFDFHKKRNSCEAVAKNYYEQVWASEKKEVI